MAIFEKILEAYRTQKNGIDLVSLTGTLNLNLGCGNKPIKCFLNTDFFNRKYADMVFNLESELPFEKESVDLIYSDNVFEHLNDVLGVIERCYTALKPNGFLVIKVPYFKSKHAFVDPTHVRFFTIETLDYFVLGSFFNAEHRFSENSFRRMKVLMDPGRNRFFRNLIAAYAVARPNHFENSILSSLFVFNNIVYVLEK